MVDPCKALMNRTEGSPVLEVNAIKERRTARQDKLNILIGWKEEKLEGFKVGRVGLGRIDSERIQN